MHSLLQTRVKEFVHRSLLDVVDLRRTSYPKLSETSLRKEVEDLTHRIFQKTGMKFSETQTRQLTEEVVDEILGLGPLEPLLRDQEISEIMVNGPFQIFVEKEGKIHPTQASFVNEESLRTAISRIVTPLGRRVDESSPMVDARLKDGSRVNVIIPPLSITGPVVTIRKFSKTSLSAQHMIESGSITKQSTDFLKHAIRFRKNILISGSTGSGKTSLLNMLSSFIPKTERIVTIEDAAELKLPQGHVISLEARPPNVEGSGEITIRDLVRNALRMRPDRIVVGECRGPEALDMLQAMNTGHDGSMTTIHANSPRDTLSRLETMALMAGFDLPLRAIREQIASAIDLVLYLTRSNDGHRFLTHITEVCGTEGETIVIQDLFVRNFDTLKLEFLGRHPRFLHHLLPDQKTELQNLLHENLK